MNTAIAQLQMQGFDVRYPTRAIDTLKESTGNWKLPQFVQAVNSTIGDNVDQLMIALDFHQIKYTYFYLVQNMLLANKQGQEIDQPQLIQQSIEKAIELCQTHHTAIYEADQDGETTSGVRQGTKKEIAIQLFHEIAEQHDIGTKEHRSTVMAAFMEQLDMTKQGAMTYFYICKNHQN